jgi:hypothetical protein
VLEQRSTLFAAGSDAGGSPLLARPVFNSSSGAATASLASSPGVFAGNVAAGNSDQLWGLEANLTGSLLENSGFRLRWLAGVRYLELDDTLDMLQDVSLLGGGIAGFQGRLLSAGSSLSIADHFGVRNEFVGGQIGGRAGYQRGSLGVDLTAKVALGSNHEALDVIGNTTLGSRPGGGPLAPGGLLALGSNSGRFTHDEFTVVPEVGVLVSYQVTSGLRALVGYNFLYVTDVARAGDQVNLRVNPRQVPSSLEFGHGGGTLQPLPALHDSDFWAQGLTFGLEVRY